jgi:phosphoglycolate phosphatase-like HAD superfamily hydrolase
VLRLQQAAGNRAVGRVLARRAVRQTGLRSEQAINRFVHKANSFLARNGDGEIRQFADYLGAAINTELEAIGVPAVKVIMLRGMGSRAAEFDAPSWAMVLNPDVFSTKGATLMAELSSDEAANIAMTVLHEARHAEQRFRVARLQAGEGKDAGMEMDDDAAAAAAAKPLRGGGQEVREAREWRDNEIGEDATYREAVSWWTSNIRPVIKIANDAGPDAYDRLGRILKGWGGPGGAATVVREHIASARRRHKATMLADTTAITDAFDAVIGLYAILSPTSAPAEFEPITGALIDLNKAIYRAYVDQPVESDAWAAGNATHDAYMKQAAAH